MAPAETGIVEGKAAEVARAVAAEEEDLAERAQEELRKVRQKKGTAALKKYRAFVNPTKPNTSFLVKPGELVRLRDQNSPTGYRDTMREGDVRAVFTSGVLVTNDPVIIAWCEANPDKCRDANLAGTEFWFNVRQAQIPLANRDPSLDQGIDVDAALRGEGIAPTKGAGGAVSTAQAFADQANEREPTED